MEIGKFWIFRRPRHKQVSFHELRERVRFNKERTVLLICMGISLLFWFFVKMSKEYQTSREFDLEYVLPPAMEFIEPPPAKAKATIVGTGVDLMTNAIFKRNTSVVFQLGELNGSNILREDIVRKIEGAISIQVADVNPSYITIEMDSSAARMVPVVFVSELGFVKDYFQTHAVTLKPDSAMVTGAPEILAQILFVRTKPLVLANIQQPVQKMLGIDVSDEGLFKVIPYQVEVFIPVEQFIQKTFDIPIVTVGRDVNMRLIPSTASLKCSIPLSKYDQTAATDFLLEADFSGTLNHAVVNTVPVKMVKSPEWAKSIQFNPRAVEYYIVQ